MPMSGIGLNFTYPVTNPNYLDMSKARAATKNQSATDFKTCNVHFRSNADQWNKGTAESSTDLRDGSKRYSP